MTDVAYNIVLFNKRKEENLTRKEASKKLHISRLSLFLYEKGYYVIPKKLHQRFIDFYNLPADFFENNLLYPSPLNNEDKKKNKRTYKILTHRTTKVILFVLFAGLVACIPTGYVYLSQATANITSYYSEQFQGIREATLKYGEKSVDKGTENVGYTYSKIFSHEGINSTIGYFFYEKESKIKEWMANATFFYQDSTQQLDITMKTAILYKGVSVSVKVTVDKTKTIFVDFLHSSTEYTVTSAYDIYGNKFTEDKYQQAEEAARLSLKIINTFFESFNEEMLGTKFSQGYDFDHFCDDGIRGYDSYKASFSGSTLLFIISSVTAVIVALLIFLSFYLTKKKDIYTLDKTLVDSIDINEEPIYGDDKKKAKEKLKKKNFFFPHIFFEPVTRTIVVLFLLFSSLSFFAFLLSIVSMGFNIMNVTDQAAKTAKFLLEMKRVAGSLVCVATMLHVFMKFDTFISYRNYIVSIIRFIFLGLLLYIFEITVVYSAQKGLNNFSEIINLFSAYFPSNMFFGLAAYSLVAMFLFSMPKRMEKSITRQHIWRTLVILPIAYLIFSIIYNVGIKAYSWTKSPYPISLLLYPESLITTIFVVAFCFGVFIYRKYIHKKYDQEGFDSFVKGTKYVLFKNILAASIVLLLGIIELIFKFGVPESKATNVLKLGSNFLILIAVPIMLFYRPHFGERNRKADTAYIISYGTSYSLSFILILILILPCINLLMPILLNLIAYLLG